MAAGAGQYEIVAVDLVEKQPVRLDVAIAVSAPFACQGMFIEAGGSGSAAISRLITSRRFDMSMPRLWARRASRRNCPVWTGVRTESQACGREWGRLWIAWERSSVR